MERVQHGYTWKFHRIIKGLFSSAVLILVGLQEQTVRNSLWLVNYTLKLMFPLFYPTLHVFCVKMYLGGLEASKRKVQKPHV